MSTVHIVGAGLAGLACAVRVIAAEARVVIHDAAPQAGGRSRSFFDATLDRTIDNGSHLMLSGNRALLGLLATVGAADRLQPVQPAAFPFRDLRTGESWTLRPGGLWLFDPGRRVPGSRATNYLAALKTLFAGPAASVADVLAADGPLFERLWAPLAVAGLNGAPDRVSARLFGAILRETLLRGEACCRPLIAREGLSAALVDPALAWLAARGAEVRLGCRVDGLDIAGGRVTALSVGGTPLPLGPTDTLVLAVPPWAAERLLPELAVPPPGRAIVNAHFRLDAPPPTLPGRLPFLGLIGGTAEWLFVRGDVLSVTVSNADHLAERPADAVAAVLWADVARTLGLNGLPPPARVIKERRATFDQAPEYLAKRPATHTALANLFFAGDWVDTGLPATLEGAVRSGEAAAAAALNASLTTFAPPCRFPAFPLRRNGHI
ncbi:MAG TPA: hydroxysqualene dehydroxylase HpnE [Azospirillum sp.]|nr:hydroxysqualene dehydroxylase HpnE [Azospirillum sp.]